MWRKMTDMTPKLQICMHWNYCSRYSGEGMEELINFINMVFLKSVLFLHLGLIYHIWHIYLCPSQWVTFHLLGYWHKGKRDSIAGAVNSFMYFSCDSASLLHKLSFLTFQYYSNICSRIQRVTFILLWSQMITWKDHYFHESTWNMFNFPWNS